MRSLVGQSGIGDDDDGRVQPRPNATRRKSPTSGVVAGTSLVAYPRGAQAVDRSARYGATKFVEFRVTDLFLAPMATCQGDPHWRFHAVPKGTPNWPTLTDEQRCWAERHFNVDHKLIHLWTMVPIWQSIMTHQAVMALADIRGDIVELGVFKGGSSALMALAQMRAHNEHNASARTLWLFDTFEGLPAPTEHDDAKAVKIWEALRAWEAGNATAEQRRDIEWRKKAGIVQRTESGALGWDYGALQQVQANLLSTKYPSNRLRFVKEKSKRHWERTARSCSSQSRLQSNQGGRSCRYRTALRFFVWTRIGTNRLASSSKCSGRGSLRAG